MSDTPYSPPLDQLLALGEPEMATREEWPDYLALGIEQEHLPELIRMANDTSFYDLESDDPPHGHLCMPFAP